MNVNPICAAMNWPVPGRREILIIELDGRWIAQLTPYLPDQCTFEGLYLLDGNGRARGGCFAIVGDWPPEQVRASLADKLGINPARLADLKTDIIAPHKYNA